MGVKEIPNAKQFSCADFHQEVRVDWLIKRMPNRMYPALTEPPASLAFGDYTSDTEIRLIEERTLTLASNLSVDVEAAPGTYTDFSFFSGSIAQGTEVTSFILHQDGATNGIKELNGSVTFSQPILGLSYTINRLTGSDALLGHPDTTTYDQNTGRRLENPDSLTLSNDLKTLTINNFATSSFGDNLRVVVAAVPEPSAFLCLTLVGVAAGFRRRWNSYTSLG